ncbi:MAG: hypothetical protein J5718_05260 [Lachnospiraceae bacterium]|nr:hypothetical protein [Lachnospiraceae bacterium]
MIRILKTDLFRLFRSKVILSYPIVIIAAMVLGALFSVKTDSQSEEKDEAQVVSVRVDGGYVVKDYVPTDDPNLQGHVYTNDTAEPMNISYTEDDGHEVNVTIQPGETFVSDEKDFVKRHVVTNLPELFSSLSDGLLLLFLGITLVIFATCETRAGFIKNAAGCALDRRYMPLSKMIIGIVILLMYTVEYFVIQLAGKFVYGLITGRTLFIRTGFLDGDAGKFWGYIGICLLIHIAFIALTVMIHELLANRAIGIVFALLIGGGTLESLANAVVYLLNHFFGILQGFDINKYLLLKNIENGFYDEAYHPQIMLVMTAIYIAAGAVLAMFIAKKKDIR